MITNKKIVSCPNCGEETKKTGNTTPGNTPERRCPACRWLNWWGRPEHTGPPYENVEESFQEEIEQTANAGKVD